MLGFLKNLFGGKSVDYAELVKNGAQIIDVRTPAEFNGGHVKGAKNVPLQSLSQNLGKINKNKPVKTNYHKMRNFFSDWNLRRIVYLIGGIWIVAQSVMDKMWILIPFGLYFVAMSVFKFGCASGNCTVTNHKNLP